MHLSIEAAKRWRIEGQQKGDEGTRTEKVRREKKGGSGYRKGKWGVCKYLVEKVGKEAVI